MNHLRNVFHKKRKCITYYLTVGYPNEDDFFRNIDILVNNGMDILELGIPVEKPYLDGKTIANTFNKVLEKEFDLGNFIGVGNSICSWCMGRRCYIFVYDNSLGNFDKLFI